MTRLVNIGFETGDLLDLSTYAGPAAASTTQKYTGGYSLYLVNATANITIPTPGDVLYVSLFWYPTSLNGPVRLWYFKGNADDNLLEFGTSGSLQARLTRNNTELAVSTQTPFTVDTWHHIEFYVYIADSGGRGVMKINGVTVIDYTGDTKPGTPSNVYILYLYGGTSVAHYTDDIIINDDGGSAPDNTYPGRVRLFPLRPSGAGSYTQWDASAGSNYDCVNEVPASSSDYVYTTVDNEIDSYALDNLSGLPSGATFKSVIVVAEALLDSGSKKLALGVRSGSTDSFGSDKTIGVSYLPYYERFTTDPADSNPWTESDINALEVAIKSRA